MKKEKSCGAVVYRMAGDEPLFLIEHMARGHTSIPKGHMKKKETEEETALREIREETHLKVKLDTGFRHVVTYSPGPGVEKDVVFFLAEAKKGKTVNREKEVASLEWGDFDTAVAAMTYETDRETLRLAKEYMEEQGG